MRKIRTLTVVTSQGVNTYKHNKNTKIIPGEYRHLGDPFDCFHVVRDGNLIGEIRCIHNLEIEYYPLEEI